jgi:hypothetical protein
MIADMDYCGRISIRHRKKREFRALPAGALFRNIVLSREIPHDEPGAKM